MDDIAIKIEKLKKQYRLGTISGTTLNAELQSWWARKRGKEDPNLKLGQEDKVRGEVFFALDGIDLEVRTGEALGIIGANGAGKSTLLKVLSKVTAPTKGDIWIRGRVSSMLEVGTGFHGELTGRENIYMNGAILGMNRKEVDAKMDSIIEFSECGQFIDTPVKRYSSGMYVKLAFAVAAHLDSEILIMDEVLAVGDMNFQKKCLAKMSDIATNDGRTVLYVSHNMMTIRNLCTRCVVLNKGKVVFDGDVEKAIAVYMNTAGNGFPVKYDCKNLIRDNNELKRKVWIHAVEFVDKKRACYDSKEKIRFKVIWEALEDVRFVKLRLAVKYAGTVNVGMAETENCINAKKGNKYENIFEYDASNLSDGIYYFKLFLFSHDDLGNAIDLDGAMSELYIEIVTTQEIRTVWKPNYWGYVRLNKIVCIK
ncbi:ABC transporter ATP-binding protein [Lachnospiraceae bacterium 54-11]